VPNSIQQQQSVEAGLYGQVDEAKNTNIKQMKADKTQ